jgi:hypothetical protein
VLVQQSNSVRRGLSAQQTPDVPPQDLIKGGVLDALFKSIRITPMERLDGVERKCRRSQLRYTRAMALGVTAT